MGSRNFDFGALDMKAEGRVALEEGMQSFSSIDIMADRWKLIVARVGTRDIADFVRKWNSAGKKWSPPDGSGAIRWQ